MLGETGTPRAAERRFELSLKSVRSRLTLGSRQLVRPQDGGGGLVSGTRVLGVFFCSKQLRRQDCTGANVPIRSSNSTRRKPQDGDRRLPRAAERSAALQQQRPPRRLPAAPRLRPPLPPQRRAGRQRSSAAAPGKAGPGLVPGLLTATPRLRPRRFPAPRSGRGGGVCVPPPRDPRRGRPLRTRLRRPSVPASPVAASSPFCARARGGPSRWRPAVRRDGEPR